jgi:hypothetical protein
MYKLTGWPRAAGDGGGAGGEESTGSQPAFASVYRTLRVLCILRIESLQSHIQKVALKFSQWRMPLNKGGGIYFCKEPP